MGTLLFGPTTLGMLPRLPKLLHLLTRGLMCGLGWRWAFGMTRLFLRVHWIPWWVRRILGAIGTMREKRSNRRSRIAPPAEASDDETNIALEGILSEDAGVYRRGQEMRHARYRAALDDWLSRQAFPLSLRNRRMQLLITQVGDYYVVIAEPHAAAKARRRGNTATYVYRFVYDQAAGSFAGGRERYTQMRPDNTHTDLLQPHLPQGMDTVDMGAFVDLINDADL